MLFWVALMGQGMYHKCLILQTGNAYGAYHRVISFYQQMAFYHNASPQYAPAGLPVCSQNETGWLKCPIGATQNRISKSP